MFAKFVLRLSSGWLQPLSLWGQPVPLLWACPFLEVPCACHPQGACSSHLWNLHCTGHQAWLLPWEVKWSQVAQSCPTLCDSMDCSPPGSSVHRSSPGKNTGAGCHFLLQGIFLPRDWTRLSCISCIGRRILYHWQHQTVSINLYVSLIPVLYCPDFGCFVFSFKMGKCDSYSFVLFQYF